MVGNSDIFSLGLNFIRNIFFSEMPKGDRKPTVPEEWTHLTCYERRGLRDILDLFKHLPRNKWNVPLDIINPLELLEDSKVSLSKLYRIYCN